MAVIDNVGMPTFLTPDLSIQPFFSSKPRTSPIFAPPDNFRIRTSHQRQTSRWHLVAGEEGVTRSSPQSITDCTLGSVEQPVL